MQAQPCRRSDEYAPDYRIQYQPSGSNRTCADSIPKCSQNYACFRHHLGMKTNGSLITWTTAKYFREPKTYECLECTMNGCVGDRYVNPTKRYDDQCGVGYEGPLCGVCSPGYTRMNENCVECHGAMMSMLILFGGGLFMVLVFIVFIYISVCPQFRSPSAERASVLVKMFLNHIQIISLCSGFSIPWGSMLQVFFTVSQEVSSPSGDILLVGCVVAFDAYDRFVGWVLVPIVAVVLIGTVSCCVTWRSFLHSRGKKKTQPSQQVIQDAYCQSGYHDPYSDIFSKRDFEDCKYCRKCCFLERVFPPTPSSTPQHKCTLPSHTLSVESILVRFHGALKRALVQRYVHQQDPIRHPDSGIGLPPTKDQMLVHQHDPQLCYFYKLHLDADKCNNNTVNSSYSSIAPDDAVLLTCDLCQEDYAVYVCEGCCQLLCPSCHQTLHGPCSIYSEHTVMEISNTHHLHDNRTIFQHSVTSIVICLHLLYPTLLREIAAMMTCTDTAVCLGDPDTEPCYHYLASDFTIACDGPRYSRYYVTSVVFFTLYGFGIPLLIMIALGWNRHRLHTESVLATLGPMYRGYRRSHYGWEIVIMVRKYAVVVLIVLTGKMSPTLQMHVAIVISLVVLGLSVLMKPWKYDVLGNIDVMSTLATVITYNCGLVLLESDTSPPEAIKTLSQSIVLVVNVGVSLVILRLFVANVFSSFKTKRLMEHATTSFGAIHQGVLGRNAHQHFNSFSSVELDLLGEMLLSNPAVQTQSHR